MLSTFDVDIFSFIYHLVRTFIFTKQKKTHIYIHAIIYFCRTEIKKSSKNTILYLY